ncbi:DUF5615 family PIN-like protein [Duganella sp. BJB1802]|uniref:DUF5615 family PIN-like protein n=1 Tax=Duganella sp. BJB1802 TaxID=2744575 RepID=UPI0015934FA0|nr:DUF5615 family PIN-like protein [Duganella sp. BJB1802]NVD70729.1 DUF5615 family PIN-like protein [Duganella sp. BJB1802]
MQILLDESLRRRFAAELSGHQVRTVVSCGWGGAKNGQVLALAATAFDVLITGDRNMQYQQNLSTLPIAVIVLATTDNHLDSLRKLVPKLLSALTNLQPRKLIELTL